MNSLSVLRGVTLSAGLALGIVALAPSAYAQNYWNGAPNATPPAPAAAPTYGPPPAAPGPYGGGPNYGGNSGVATAPQPYWHGAPGAIGPAA